MSENGLVSGVSIGVQSFCFGMPRCTVADGVYIRRAAGQNKSVQFLELAGKLFR